MNKSHVRRKFLKNSMITSVVLLVQLSVSTMVSALDVTINGSENLSLATNIVYNHQTDPSTVSFQIDSNFLCTSINASTQPIVLNVDDANDVPLATLNSGILSTEYDLSNGVIHLVTDGSIKCASPNGVHREVINRFDFDAATSDLQITLLDSNGFPFPADVEVSDQQNLDYQFVVDNNGNVPLSADLVEFFKVDPSAPFLSGVSGDDWVCNEANTSGGSTTTCGDLLAGEATVSLTNAVVDPGEQLVVSVSRTVEIPNGTVGTAIELLAAAFVTNDTDAVINNNFVYEVFGTTDNNPPTISTIGDEVIFEDSATDTLDFTVSDVETNDASLVVTAATSNASIVPVANIILGGSGSDRTVQVTPNTDTNTAAGPVTITLIVDDGITTTQEQFTLTVTPVNDAPTFTLLAIPDWPAGTVGLKSLKGFVENLSFGPTVDENSQAVLATTVTVQSDPNGIFAIGGEPQLTNNGVLTYFLSGSGGTANIDVTIQDDGGTANGGIDTSATVSFTITVLNTLPVISSVSNQIFDEDGNSSVIDFTISDAETAAAALTMSATSSDINIVKVSGIQFSGSGGSRSVQITPELNQNTVISGDVTITLIVDDGSDTTETTFDITINPINDAPIFSLASLNINNTTGDAGQFIQEINFATALGMGPTPDEDLNQNVLDYNIQVTDTSGIFDQSVVAVDINNIGTLNYVLTGSVGVATIEVSLQDDGGVANGGVDTSATQTFTVTVQSITL